MKKVTDPEFRKYGRVLDLKIPDLLERLGKTPLTDEVVYVASEPSSLTFVNDTYLLSV